MEKQEIYSGKYRLMGCFLAVVFVVVSCTKERESYRDEISVNQLASKVLPETVDFNFHIRPILSDRCFKCHGPDQNKIEAGLSLTEESLATKPLGENKDRFAIVPGDLEKSVLIKRIFSSDPSLVMPPPESNLSLNENEKKLLAKWIEDGAGFKRHWAFLPIQNVIPPEIKKNETIQNDIDKFVLSRLAKEGLSFSEIARKEHLIRRLSFTLTGLPPKIEEVEAFLLNDSPTAYSELIDEYLSRPGYGEHMASFWMDLARYADTHGYQDDLERTMWPWRDWVIHSFNTNLPYDKFVGYQLAGDLMPNASKAQIVATAFNRNHSITQEGGVIPEEYRTEYVADRTLTFGKAFLGLTMECARCHDHKYDPISQSDYYSLFSFFNNVPEKGLIEEYGAIPEPYIHIEKKEAESILSFINNLDTLDSIPLMVMEEMKNPRPTFVLDRGLYNRPTKRVFPRTPTNILDFGDRAPNRQGLSEWLFDDANPLTARVAVNRLWQICFGKGLVTTSDDFGAQGALPTHPALLDHLASKFRDEGWDVKKMLKYIVSSHTFQQSSKMSAQLYEIDPENNLYARAPRLRLSAEGIRDNILASSGLLVPTIGGPSVKPYQPDGLWKEKTGGGGGSTAEYKIDQGDKKYRRSLYTFWKRTVPPPGMMTFDAVSRDFCMVQRETTTTPLQALVMMNNPEVFEAARNLAYKVISAEKTKEGRIGFIFQAATSRLPAAVEMKQLKEYLEEQLVHFSNNEELTEDYIGLDDFDKKSIRSTTELAAFTMLANLIYNLNESVTRS